MIDAVIVAHNPKAFDMAEALRVKLDEDPSIARVIIHDNRIENLGFSKGCNRGARFCFSTVIAFLNPDVVLSGTLEAVEQTFLKDGRIVVTGCRFDKEDSVLDRWDISDGGWVCGAAFFVRRSWFEQLGGFDERFVFGFEETDFCKRTLDLGFKVQPIELPITHSPPTDDDLQTTVYKVFHMTRGWEFYKRKHGIFRVSHRSA